VTLINFIDAYNYLKLKEQIKNDTLNVIDNINLLPSMNSLLNNLRDFSKYTKINLSLIITQINNLINLYEHDKTMEDLKEFEECKQACSNLIMNILQESEVLT
jgi:ArsR family metal-binding transcriptional regulator